MKSLNLKNKIVKFVKQIIVSANSENVSMLFKNLKEFQGLASSIAEKEQEYYKKYFEKNMTHEINLLRIDYKKIEFGYKESVIKTDKMIENFEAKLADKSIKQDMRVFYQKEYLNNLKPMYVMEQMQENFKHYLEVLNLIQEEFDEWFFLGRLDFLKQLLQPYIVSEESTGKEKEIWTYKKYEKGLTKERMERMYKQTKLQT